MLFLTVILRIRKFCSRGLFEGTAHRVLASVGADCMKPSKSQLSCSVNWTRIVAVACRGVQNFTNKPLSFTLNSFTNDVQYTSSFVLHNSDFLISQSMSHNRTNLESHSNSLLQPLPRDNFIRRLKKTMASWPVMCVMNVAV